MKSCYLVAIVCVVLALIIQPLAGQSQVAPDQKIDLLNENNLEQFVNANGQPIKSKGWTVSKGVLHHTKRGGNLFYREAVKDFSLSFEFKVAKRGNSGIKYRVANYNKQWLGCEYQIQDDGNRPFNKHSTGSLYAVYEPSKAKNQNPVGEWNQGKIVVQGNRIQHWLNGVLIVDAIAGSSDWNQRVQKSKFQPHVGWGQNRSGRLMIQDHGTEVWLRNLYLTKLPDVVVSSSFITPSPSFTNGCNSVANLSCGNFAVENCSKKFVIPCQPIQMNCCPVRRPVVVRPRCWRLRRVCR